MQWLSRKFSDVEGVKNRTDVKIHESQQDFLLRPVEVASPDVQYVFFRMKENKQQHQAASIFLERFQLSKIWHEVIFQLFKILRVGKTVELAITTMSTINIF